MVAPLLEFYNSLIPFLLLAIVLIIVDSRFGVAAARKRGEPIRTSRKWRRAINKLVDYVCWVTLTLPDFMEGLSVEIVEQTDNAVLLTDTVQNGKLFVSYNTDDANYLVLRTK